MLDDQLAVADVLTSLQPPLAQPYPGLQLVIEDPLLTEQEEEVLLVALAGLTLHVPIVLPRHLVLVLLVLSVIDILKQRYFLSKRTNTIFPESSKERQVFTFLCKNYSQ